jgi:diguanylate cyclase (GGDEF)-like protein
MKYASVNTNNTEDIRTFTISQRLGAFLGVGALIFVMSLLGIYSRPTGLLATFWPANAVLLGLFVRMPHLAHPVNWLAAMLGYTAADLLTSSPLSLSLFLTFGNIVGIFVGYTLFIQLSLSHQRLMQPLSVIYLVLISVASSAAAGIVGMVGYPLYFGGAPLQGLSYWFVGELVNYLAMLPVMLTAPEITKLRFNMRRNGLPKIDPQKVAALISLAGGMLLAIVIEGPGALSFVVPGLMWCALSFNLFTSACLTLLTSLWILFTAATGYLDLGVNLRQFYSLDSFRLGVTLTSLAPLTIASVMAARNDLVRKLQFTATHDPLTHALNRAGFYEQAETVLSSGKPFAVMMLDIDYFKHVNDAYGHASGDVVLSEFAKIAADCLRTSDVFGRLGGEEFCVILPNCSAESAEAVAGRICRACASQVFLLEGNVPLKVTVSIGLTYVPALPSVAIETVMLRADQALYKAKESGRNRVVIHTA